jgi:Flp pilus assembly CpaF family ATPase
MVDAGLPDGSRVNAIISPQLLSGPVLTTSWPSLAA